MRRAIWLWDEANCEEALGENELEGEIPKCTGKQCLALQKRTIDIHFFQFWIYAKLPLFHGGNSLMSRFFQKLLVLFILFQSLFWTSHREPSAWFSRNSCYNKCVTFSQGWFWRKSSLRRATTRKKWILWWSVWFRCFFEEIPPVSCKKRWIWMDVFCSQDGWLTFVNLVRSIEILSIGSHKRICRSQKQDYSDLKFDHGSFLENQHEEIGFLPCSALLYSWHCRIRRRLRFLTHLQRVFRNGQFGCGTRRGFVAQGWWPSCATFGCIG